MEIIKTKHQFKIARKKSCAAFKQSSPLTTFTDDEFCDVFNINNVQSADYVDFKFFIVNAMLIRH